MINMKTRDNVSAILRMVNVLQEQEVNRFTQTQSLFKYAHSSKLANFELANTF